MFATLSPNRAPVADHMRELVEACLYCNSALGVLAIEGAADWFFHAVEGAYRFNRCTGCGSFWLAERMKPEFLPLAYASYYTHADEPDRISGGGMAAILKQGYVRQRFGGSRAPKDALLSAAYKALTSNRAATDAVFRHAPPAPAKILDYGCGSGGYMDRMRALGHSVTGVDFDPVVVEKVRALGMEALTPDDADNADWAGRFDFITLNHVIEHVQAPADLLTKLAGWLKPGGQLFLETPSADALGIAVLGRYWRGFEVPRHLSLVSRKALADALHAAGLTVTQDIIRPHVRTYLWQESLAVVPDGERAEMRDAVAAPPVQTAADAEFITIVASAPDAGASRRV